MGTLFCPPHGDVSVPSFCPHLPDCVSTGWPSVEARRGRPEHWWERSGAAGPRVSGVLPDKGCAHQPSVCLAEGRRALFAIPTPTFWDKSRNSPVRLNASLRDAITQQTSWVPGAREPLAAGFPDRLAAGRLPISLGACQCLSAQALWPLCTGGRPGACLHSEPQQRGPAPRVCELSSGMQPPAGREDAPALLFLWLASNTRDRRLCEASSRRAIS